jgi:hypothetical protein
MLRSESLADYHASLSAATEREDEMEDGAC